MTNCTTCTKVNESIVSPQQNEEMGCQTTVHERVCVQGTVTITPDVRCGPSRSFCMDEPIIGTCLEDLMPYCEFTVSQNICVQIPLTFSATASAVPDGLVCGTEEMGPCPGAPVGCTHSIGFFRMNSEITNALIMAAGGSITLGAGGGLSFTVTTSNANAVLNFNTPSPPAPEDPPFAGQYQNLYAQLLAANLNALSLEALGVEVCDFATDAITAANNFLTASPAGGMAGAPGVQEPLEQFNSGNAPGCPEHCDD